MKLFLSEMLNSRNNNYDFLRFFAATLVLISHSFALLGAGYEPMAVFSKDQTTFGELGVNIFFFISGLLITQSYCRNGSLLIFAFVSWLSGSLLPFDFCCRSIDH
jgi:peptidoglycan/LPS O-acetylase OafA/YrhL